MRRSVSGSREAGPIVATIFVRRIERKVSVVVVVRVSASGSRTAGRARSIDLTVLGPSRPVPRVGGQARIAHFGGGFERGVVLAVHERGRRLQVRGEGGEVLEFVLNPATARFVAAGGAHGPRLELLGDS
jgi:hypothetical protein